jgi:NADPH-dependent 2,4-dienoyl-CoA reductase/sulfur reductase-like enzyme
LLVVGASVAGVRFVEAVRRSGFPGPVTLLDAEVGDPYDKPPLSKAVLAGGKPAALTTARALSDIGVDYLDGCTATGLDVGARTVHVGDDRRSFDILVIATGSRPRMLPGAPPQTRVGYLRSASSARQLRDHLRPGASIGIVGAGFIGLEVAAVARGAGAEVHVVEAAPAVSMRGVAPAVNARAAVLHAAHGVHLHLGEAVRSVAVEGSCARIDLASGTSIRCDFVLVAIGAVPALDWLRSSGLPVADGLEADRQLRVHDSVFGLGDCVRWSNPRLGARVRLEHWTSAREQAGFLARLVAGSIAGGAGCGVLPYVWSDQHGRRIQSVGTTGREWVTRETADGSLLALHVESELVVGASAVDSPAGMATVRRLLRDEPRDIATVLDALG